MYVPSSELDSPTPSLITECAPPHAAKGGGHIRLRVRGWGSPNSHDWRKSLALCQLCAYYEKVLTKSLLVQITHAP